MPLQVLAVTVVLQALYGLPDHDAAQALRCDLRWKAACGLGLLDTGFDPSLLTYFRRRMARGRVTLAGCSRKSSSWQLLQRCLGRLRQPHPGQRDRTQGRRRRVQYESG